jgi:4-diphosphocytidyl-2-C-methyl-D-erythritol kinase
LADQIELNQKVTEFSFTTNDPSIPTDKRNTVIKAIDKLGLSDRKFSIHLTKNIPHEAGLGGGSGNAATVLKELNERFNLGKSHSEIMSLAGEIGSDVPFFIEGGICDIQGRGEIIEKKEDYFTLSHSDHETKKLIIQHKANLY